MKKKSIKAAAISVGLLILIIAIKAIVIDEAGHQMKIDRKGTVASERESRNPPGNDIIDNRPDSIVRTNGGKSPESERAAYKIVGRENVPLDLDKATLMERIDEGVKTMEIVEHQLYPDEEISTMKDAYNRLFASLPFPLGSEPIWGVDKDLFFVFSGRKESNPNLAFTYGFAVKKENGRIYRWFAPQDK